MTHTYSAGRRSLSPDDVGKDVVNSYGARVGAAAEGTCREALVVDPDPDAASLGLAEAETDEPVRLRAEDVELVDDSRVWLRR